MDISIITRTKNELDDLIALSKALKAQSVLPKEVIVVDNNSIDGSNLMAESLGFVTLSTNEYFPGKALNLGINHAKGELVVLISCHCLPASKNWLEKLVLPFKISKSIAGVYGRQLPTEKSTPLDFRDLTTVFRNESQIQKKDFYFHNANSAIRKEIWKQFPFSNTATNIEDRIWAKSIVSSGYEIYYASDAAVFHPHGINHNGDIVRANKIKKVCDDFALYPNEYDLEWYLK